MMTLVSKTAHGSVTCVVVQTNTGSYVNGSSQAFSFSHSTVNSIKIPSIGMLAANRNASTIYQFKDAINYKIANKTGTISDVALNKGMVLLAAEKDVKIVWSPRFTKGQVYDGTNKKWVDSSATRVKLLLSVGQFSDKIASTKIIKADSPVGTTTDGGVLCNICASSSDEATQISFTMPEDGVVYAKWVPDTSDYDTAKWIQPLDLSQSSTYTQITE